MTNGSTENNPNEAKSVTSSRNTVVTTTQTRTRTKATTRKSGVGATQTKKTARSSAKRSIKKPTVVNNNQLDAYQSGCCTVWPD